VIRRQKVFAYGYILDMLNRSHGDLAYTIIDVNKAPSDALVAKIAAIEGVLKVRTL